MTIMYNCICIDVLRGHFVHTTTAQRVFQIGHVRGMTESFTCHMKYPRVYRVPYWHQPLASSYGKSGRNHAEVRLEIGGQPMGGTIFGSSFPHLV